MKIVNFRDDVLHAVAQKMGLDPEQGNFLTNQALPLGKYIDEWVRRAYDARDWPELVVTRKFEPVNHIVPWEGIDDVYGSRKSFKVGRILKVYLIDPRTTDAPVDTPFSLLMSGIHVGYEHGTNVWIRYLFPPPRYTAEVWDANTTYRKDQVTYSPFSGECYRSRVYGNINHDPSKSFQLPPLPPDEETPEVESETPPVVDVFQEYIPSDPGSPGQTGIFRININLLRPGPNAPDPVTSGTFQIRVVDADGIQIGSAGHAVSGSESLSSITSDLAAQLVSSLPMSFVVTTNTITFSVTLEDLSGFGISQGYYSSTDPATVKQFMRVAQNQTYIPPRDPVIGQAQATSVTITGEATIPGGLYRLTMTGSDGTPHPIEYQSLITDTAAQMIEGWVAAIAASSDDFWTTVTLQAAPGQGILFLEIEDNASTSAAIILIGDPYWEWNPFPQVLAEQVVRGAYADLLKEWGQTDKGLAEEQQVPAEAATSEGDFATTPNPPLSGQQVPMSRYKQ